ncbi:hypothetical protein [Hyphomicrobium sp.]|jgi:hypothetical protein|uniref:hypothetical protein n=1 Tax=Hyphomicrobium sp. TaxID=82 RepID=UPI00356A9383
MVDTKSRDEINTKNQSPDIRRSFDSDFVVIGFFTPNYEPSASAFSKNLIEHRISHHLYARPVLGDSWYSQTRQKPTVLALARTDYPDRPLIFMDVDCTVRGDVSGILQSPGDLAMRTKGTALGSVRRALKPTTRVLLLRPTAGADAFVAAWEAGCQHAGKGDSAEAVLIEVMSDSPERYAVGTLPLTYAGIELHDAPVNAVIVHDSIHDQTRPAWALRRSAQRYFRAGRNAAFRLATGKTYDERYGKRGARSRPQ